MDRILKNPKGSPIYRNSDSGFYTTPKGSNVYSNHFDGFYTTLKVSNVYRNNRFVGDSTPLGSHVPMSMFFYTHQIPLGLFWGSIGAGIQKGLAELKILAI